MLTNLEEQYTFPSLEKTLHKMLDYETVEIDNNEKLLFFEIQNKSYRNLENILKEMIKIEGELLKNYEKKKKFSCIFDNLYYKLSSKIVLINEIEYKIIKININLNNDFVLDVYFISDSNIYDDFKTNFFVFDDDKILISSFLDGFIGAINLLQENKNWTVLFRYFNELDLHTENDKNSLLDRNENTILDIKINYDVLTIIFIQEMVYLNNIRDYSKSALLKSCSNNFVEMCSFVLGVTKQNKIDYKIITNSEITMVPTLEEYYENEFNFIVSEEYKNNNDYYSLLIFKENDIQNELEHSLIIINYFMTDLKLTFKNNNYNTKNQEELEDFCSLLIQKLDLNECNLIENVDNVLLYHNKIEINKQTSNDYYDIYYFSKSNQFIDSILVFKMKDDKSHNIIKNFGKNFDRILFCPNEINKNNNKFYQININYFNLYSFEINCERKLNVLDIYVENTINTIVIYCSYYGFLTDLIVFCKDEKGFKKVFREIKRKENNLLLSTNFKKIEFSSDKKFKICYDDVKESFSIEKNNRRNILVKN